MKSNSSPSTAFPRSCSWSGATPRATPSGSLSIFRKCASKSPLFPPSAHCKKMQSVNSSLLKKIRIQSAVWLRFMFSCFFLIRETREDLHQSAVFLFFHGLNQWFPNYFTWRHSFKAEKISRHPCCKNHCISQY